MEKINRVLLSISLVVFLAISNCAMFFNGNYWWLFLTSIIGIVVNCLTGFFNKKVFSTRLKICNHGVICLKVFYISMIVSIVLHIVYAIAYTSDNFGGVVISLINCYLLHLILFWNGIISVYCTSAQLGIKNRIIGVILGPIPILHLIFLTKIISICSEEVKFESSKIELNESRKEQQICKTKYPILLVHGVFFRDYKALNYWGRVPKELEANGATLFYGEHSSALSVLGSSKELYDRIKEIVETTGCEKVNIIAHSKGGLDARAVLDTDMRCHIASLTTINTPHKGCEFADYLLNKATEEIKSSVSKAYNFAASKLGDKEPDFLSAVSDLTHSKCCEFNIEHPTPCDVLCQSFGSVLKGATSPRFPLNLTYRFIKSFDGDHDGLVSVDAFEFGEKFTLLEPTSKRGISHADVIDLNRENVPGFDIREFYVSIVADLKNRGL